MLANQLSVYDDWCWLCQSQTDYVRAMQQVEHGHCVRRVRRRRLAEHGTAQRRRLVPSQPLDDTALTQHAIQRDHVPPFDERREADRAFVADKLGRRAAVAVKTTRDEARAQADGARPGGAPRPDMRARRTRMAGSARRGRP